MILGSDAIGTFTTIATDDFSNGYNLGLWGNPFHGAPVGQGGATWNRDDVTVTGGELQVAATRHGDGSWTVGGFNSLTNGPTVTYGRVSFDARVEEAQGTMAAILMWPANNVWPPEIDILETPGRDVMHTVHYRDAAGVHQYDAIRNQSYDPTQWHRYQMTWLPDLIRIEVDGRTVAEWSDPQKIPDTAMGFGAMMYVAKSHEEWIGGAPDGTTPGKVVTRLDNVTIQRWDEGGPPPPPAPAVITLGQGAQELTLRLSQDAWQGDARYSIAVDGVQMGNELTAQALRASGQSDIVRVRGDWGPGEHRVSVTFLNDGWGGHALADRNLYVDGATLDGTGVAGAAASLTQNGAHGFGFSVAAPATPPPPAATTIGSGADTLLIRVSQDAWQGDAQFTVSVDGRQVGGMLTAQALHGSGQSDTITVKGDWGAGQHRVEVAFLNDAWGGTTQADRNLYVDGAAWNGTAVGGAQASLFSTGAHGFVFTVAAAPAAPVAPAATTIGSGTDSITLRLSQDAYQGDAQFTVAVDGRQIGGVLSAKALQASGLSDSLVVRGNWGPGEHRVTVSFINDKWDGTAGTDRNLYVDGLSVGGTPVAGASAALMSNGSASFGFALAASAAVTLGSGSDVLTLRVAQDAYQGAAQYVVAVDGVQIGGVQTASALRAGGQTDSIAVRGTWSAGDHVVTIQFLNDLWHGTAETDRNLYIDGASFSATEILAARATMLSAGKHSFGFRK